MRKYKTPREQPDRPVHVWVSRDYGVLELRGPRWKMGWDHHDKSDHTRTRLRRLHLPTEIETALEYFLQAMARHAVYVRSIEIHRPVIADKVEASLKAFRKKGVDWTK